MSRPGRGQRVIASVSGPAPRGGRPPDRSRCPRGPAPCPAAVSRGPPGGMTAARRASTGAAHGARSHHNRTLRLSPAARLSDRGPQRPGRLTAPASPAGLRPVLDPPGPLTQVGSSRGTGHTTAPGRHTRPAGQSSTPQTRGTRTKDLKAPRHGPAPGMTWSEIWCDVDNSERFRSSCSRHAQQPGGAPEPCPGARAR